MSVPDTYSKLSALIRASFNSEFAHIHAPLTVSFIDIENDEIWIENDVELAAAYAYAARFKENTLKLILEE